MYLIRKPWFKCVRLSALQTLYRGWSPEDEWRRNGSEYLSSESIKMQVCVFSPQISVLTWEPAAYIVCIDDIHVFARSACR